MPDDVVVRLTNHVAVDGGYAMAIEGDDLVVDPLLQPKFKALLEETAKLPPALVGVGSVLEEDPQPDIHVLHPERNDLNEAVSRPRTLYPAGQFVPVSHGLLDLRLFVRGAK